MKNIIRALRLPFISATVLPFIAGSLLAMKDFHFLNFALGLLAAVSVHLGANLINDYADSRSGVDWQDKRFFGFFGGSKLIQEGVYSPRLYFGLAIALFATAFFSIACVSLMLKTSLPLAFLFIIIILSWSYSEKPLQLSYRRLGEPIIFLLFGPALVMGGYFLQTKIFPDLKSFIVSLPFGILTTAILFANEIPDFSTDSRLNKNTWVGLWGVDKAYWGYYCLLGLAFVSIIVGIYLKYLNLLSLFSFLFLPLGLKAGRVLKQHYNDKTKLIASSAFTIKLQLMVSLILIISILL